MKNLTSSFKTLFVIYIVLFLLGVVVSCVFGLNTFATLGKGQQLVYELSGDKDNYNADIEVVKTYLKDNGAGMITEQISYDAFGKAESIVFTFKTNEALANQVKISGQDCQVFDIDNSQAKRTVVSATIALCVALVLVFAYLAIRYIKNNWLAHSVGTVCCVVLNWLAIFGIIQIAGLFGYEFDTTITTAFAYTMLLTAVMFLSMTALSYYKAENKKISLAEGVRSANKTLSCYYWVFSLVIAVVCIVLSVIAGSAFVIKLVPIAIASIICALTATKVAPAFWLMFLQKTEESAKSGK